MFQNLNRKSNVLIIGFALIAFFSAYWMWLDKSPLVSIPSLLFLASICLLLLALQAKQWLVLGLFFEQTPRERAEDTVQFMQNGKLQVLLIFIGLFIIFGSQTQTGLYKWFLLVSGIILILTGIIQFINRKKIIHNIRKSVRRKKK